MNTTIDSSTISGIDYQKPLGDLLPEEITHQSNAGIRGALISALTEQVPMDRMVYVAFTDEELPNVLRIMRDEFTQDVFRLVVVEARTQLPSDDPDVPVSNPDAYFIKTYDVTCTDSKVSGTYQFSQLWDETTFPVTLS